MSYSKNQTLNEILKKIDLTKTQRERAKELYTNLCKSIEQKSGLKINFYSQHLICAGILRAETSRGVENRRKCC